MDPNDLITAYEALADRYAAAVGAELDCEAERPAAKHEAIRRLMAEPNPLTGKPHSASSAETIAEMDPEYGAFLRRRRDVVIEKNRVYGQMEATRLRVNVALSRPAA